MKEFYITTIERVNIREGPGISYKSVAISDEYEEFFVTELKTDESGVTWYKIDEKKYICSKYCLTSVISKKGEKKEKNETKTKTKRYTTIDTNINKIETKLPGANSGESMKDVTDPFGVLSGSIGSIGSPAMNAVLGKFLGSDGSSASQTNLLEMQRRKIFGTPFQFLPSTDIRPNEEINIGRMYATNILSEAPVLSLLPCKPNYLPGISKAEKNQLTKILLNKISEHQNEVASKLGDEFISGLETKYFSTDINYSEYIKYVNFLCRTAAIYMGIGDRLVPGFTTKYKEFNWGAWNKANTALNDEEKAIMGRIEEEVAQKEKGYLGKLEEIYEAGKEVAGEAIGTVVEAGEMAYATVVGKDIQEIDPDFLARIGTEQFYVDFYVTPSTSYSESFANRTEESKFASAMNKGSDLMKELSFALGAHAIDTESFQENIATVSKHMREMAEKIAGNKDNLFSRLLMDAQTIISGSNLIFPKIWHSSERSQSYRAEIKLVTPYSDSESIYLNLLVPMFHLLVFALPRQTSVNSYGSPFIIKAHMSKWFSCEMGIIDSLEIQKSGWNAEGFPTEITMSLGITDLYSALSISKADSPLTLYRGALNQSLLEYMSILCGMNLKRSEFKIKMDMIESLVAAMPGDAKESAKTIIRQTATNMATHILGALGTSGGSF